MSTAAAYDARPWLARYGAGQPADIEPEFHNMLDVCRAALERNPDAPFLLYFDGKLSLRELDQASDALARTLLAQGFRSGDRLALYTQNNPGWVIGLLAAWKAGGIGVAVNPMNRQRELSYVLQNSGARALLCLDILYTEVVSKVQGTPDIQVDIIVTTSALDFQQQNDARVFDDSGRLAVADGVLDLLAVIAETGSEPLPVVAPESGDVALLTYTSGTTGNPKGAMNTHGNMTFNAQTYRDWIGLTPEDRILGIAPLFHITGSVGHVATALLVGCPLILAHRFHPEAMLDVMRAHRPTFTVGAITAFIALMHSPEASGADFASFRAIFSGGAPISPATNEAFQTFSGHYIHNAYGMTETASPTHCVPLGSKAPVDPTSGALSIGVPVFNTLVRIVGEDGQPLPVGEIGEIVDQGPQIMSGYWENPEATAQALAGGWMHTGDVGFMDADGWFYLVDRKNDMINAAGYKVWPREVEDVLYGHPAVREAAVVGVPDNYRGETVKAVVALKAGTDVTADELIAFCRERMAAYKYPRIVEFLDELPKTVTGKILRRSLRGN